MKELMARLRQFNQERDWDQFHSPENLAKSIVIEAGELLECFQWDDQYDHQAVCYELADVLTYAFMMADRLGVDVKEIMLEKLAITEKKYPIAKAKGSSVKYDQFNEE